MHRMQITAVHDPARAVFLIATFFAAAALVAERGLSIFAIGLVVATLLQWAVGRSASPTPMPGLKILAAMVLLIISTAGLSVALHALPLASLDNVARLSLLPWCAWLAYRTGTGRAGVWYGGCTGVALAFCLACRDIVAGEPRAGGGGNPIVFANLSLLLLAIVLFAAPGWQWRHRLLSGLALVAGAGVILLSGSRAALLIFILLLWTAVLHHVTRRARTSGILSTILLLVVIGGAVAWLPVLREPLRLDMIVPNVRYYLAGNPDTPVGARLQLLKLAWESFMTHPWQGVGIGNFASVIREWTGCRQDPAMGMCVLEHAHNDVAEWAATLGIPGLLAILSLYVVPLAMFVAIIRTGRGRPSRAAWTGVMVVLVHVLCGLTQSMFSHAVTSSAYALFTGTLLGMAWWESHSTETVDR